jgi:hypothetical protein
MHRPWFPNFGEHPTTDGDESDEERAMREEAERELYAELEQREYVEVVESKVHGD